MGEGAQGRDRRDSEGGNGRRLGGRRNSGGGTGGSQQQPQREQSAQSKRGAARGGRGGAGRGTGRDATITKAEGSEAGSQQNRRGPMNRRNSVDSTKGGSGPSKVSSVPAAAGKGSRKTGEPAPPQAGVIVLSALGNPIETGKASASSLPPNAPPKAGNSALGNPWNNSAIGKGGSTKKPVSPDIQQVAAARVQQPSPQKPPLQPRQQSDSVIIQQQQGPRQADSLSSDQQRATHQQPKQQQQQSQVKQMGAQHPPPQQQVRHQSQQQQLPAHPGVQGPAKLAPEQQEELHQQQLQLQLQQQHQQHRVQQQQIQLVSQIQRLQLEVASLSAHAKPQKTGATNLSDSSAQTITIPEKDDNSGPTISALVTLQEDIVRLQRENESLKTRNIEIETSLQKKEELVKKYSDEKSVMENVLKMYGNIRADVEQKRDEFNKLWKKEEAAKKEALMELAELKRNGFRNTGSQDHTLSARVATLDQQVHRLEQELSEKTAALECAQREVTIKSLDLEVREAQEEYSKIRIDNMEVELEKKSKVISELSERLEYMTGAFQEQQTMIEQLMQVAQRESAVVATVSTGTSMAHVQMADAETQESKSFSLDNAPHNVSSKPASDENFSRDHEEEHKTTIPDEDFGSDHLQDEEHVEDFDEEYDDNITEGEAAGRNAEVNVDDESDDWLFSIEPSERETLLKTIDFLPEEVQVVPDARKLATLLVSLLDELDPENSSLRERLESSRLGTRAFWLSARELLSVACSYNFLFIFPVGAQDSAEQKRLQRQFVNVLAEAYEGAESPGKVVIAFEGSPAVDRVEGLDPTESGAIPVDHKVHSLSMWLS